MSIDVTAKPLTQRVAEEIRVLMLRRGLKGGQLAKTLGVSAAWVSYRLTGTQPIDLNDLERIAAVLGVRPIDLLSAAEGSTTLREGPAPFIPSQRSPSRPPNRIDATGPDKSMSGPRRASRLTRPSGRVA